MCKEIQGLVLLTSIDSSFVLDLKYATTDNFTKKRVYPVDACILQKNTAKKLILANEEFKKEGYVLKIWDAYRPIYVQHIFWNMIQDRRFVANPNIRPSRHNYGTAVDVTLVDANNVELQMPSKFDDFTERASRKNADIAHIEKKNLDYLTEKMHKYGFITIDTEWWHFEDCEYAKYPLVDVQLEQFLSLN
jgi:D-alanyl-D-alanine dipeptidase